MCLREFLLQICIIDEIAVMAHSDPKRDTGPKRLGFIQPVTAGGRVPGVPDAEVPLQPPPVPLAEDIADQASAFLAVKAVRIAGHDPRRILSSVLQVDQALVELARDRAMRDDTDNTTHDSINLRLLVVLLRRRRWTTNRYIRA